MNTETVYKCSFCSASYDDRKNMPPFMDCPCKGYHFGIPAKYVVMYSIFEREEYICALKSSPRKWIDSDE